jgi:hypothetical protein
VSAIGKEGGPDWASASAMAAIQTESVRLSPHGRTSFSPRQSRTVRRSIDICLLSVFSEFMPACLNWARVQSQAETSGPK